MGNKKTPKNVTSNTSTAANPAASSETHIAQNSSILRSSFAPFRFGAPFFASVIQGLDSQRLRIHDTTNGRLLCEHAIASRASITCLDWGHLGGNSLDDEDQGPKKKRRKGSTHGNGVSPSQDIVLAFGTSASEIQIYSPGESKILVTLKDAHSGGIRDYKFAENGREGKAYSVGGDGKLVQWDLKQGTAIMSMILPSGPANTICPVEGNVICASHLAYLVNLNLKESSNPYHASTNTVHTIFSKPTQHQDQREFLTVAEIDHSISVFKEDSPTLIGSLRTENEVLAADIWWIGHHPKNSSQDLTNRMAQPEYALAAVNKDGTLEIFPEPFGFPAASSGKNAESLKARMKHRSRPSAAQVKIVRAEKETEQVPLIGASFQGNQIILAWVEGGLNVIFDTIRWRDEETSILLLKDATEIVKRKSGAGLGAVSMNGAKDMGRSHVDDSHAVVANGADVDDVSMDEVGQQVIDISSAEEEGASEGGQPVARLSGSREDVEDEGKDEDGDNLADEEDEDMEDAGSRDGSPEQEVGSPSFGDLIRASASDPIDVPHNLPDDHPQSLVPANSTSVQPLSSGLSLGTVLTQSLRTNDTNLLETCFHTQDLPTVRATIERLDSSFATILLQRLAERLHSRPGRAGSLMVWVQWTLVAHGGYLAGQPEMMRRLRNLHKVVKERAGSLQSLLNLKGKLDMLEAQMNLRRSVLERGRGANAEEEDDEDAVIYVEGQEEDDSSDEDELDNQGGGSDDDDEHTDAFSSRASQTRLSKDTDVQRNQVEANGDEDDDMPPTTTGPPIDSEAASDSDEDGMIDDEASETDNASSDELDDEDIDHDSIDISSSDEEAPPPPPPDKKRAKGTGKLSNGIGPRGH